jgi:hypothetical protein
MEWINNNTRWLVCGLIVLLNSLTSINISAQSTEAQQLLLNVEKLSQFKNILSDMKEGYSVISSGYNAVKEISKGNFSLHQGFMDGLMLVNPEIKKYSRIADIITYQKNILSEYKSAETNFKQSNSFNQDEISYLGQVYTQILDKSLDNLDQLTTILTSSKLRMSDEDRLRGIDRIFEDTQDKLMFLRSFNTEAYILSAQRLKEKSDIVQRSSFY